jgi:hypothetical protein
MPPREDGRARAEEDRRMKEAAARPVPAEPQGKRKNEAGEKKAAEKKAADRKVEQEDKAERRAW